MKKDNSPIIHVDGLWKQYGLPPILSKPASLLRRFIGRMPQASLPDPSTAHWALQDVSFDVKKGENLGVIGRNGAGKSTLLKILSGVSPPTHGTISVKGHVFPMLETSAGLHPELTGRENIRLLGVVMGLTLQEIEEKRPQIEEFSELEEWLDEPVITYSTGMLGRLGFSAAAHVDAEILLIDEVLAVGDIKFQKKCIARMEKLRQDGVTTILVTHNPYTAERICDRVMLFDQGRLVELGTPSDVIHAYFKLVDPAPKRSETSTDNYMPSIREGAGDLRVTAVELFDDTGNQIYEARTGSSLVIRLKVKTRKPIHAPNITFRIIDHQGTVLMSMEYLGRSDGITIDDAGTIDCRIDNLPLMPEVYTLLVKLTSHVTEDGFYLSNWLRIVANDMVVQKTGNKGLVYADAEWNLSQETGNKAKPSPS